MHKLYENLYNSESFLNKEEHVKKPFFLNYRKERCFDYTNYFNEILYIFEFIVMDNVLVNILLKKRWKYETKTLA